jgi:lysophospholipase L1-like esterase
MYRVVTVTYLLLATSAAYARVYSPRVVSPHNADCYSMKTFADFARWRDLKGDARAWEIYKYLVDTRTGVFHMNEVLEGDDTMGEYRTIRDPVKIINVYGYAYCGIFGPMMAGVCELAGVGKGRSLGLPAWSHSVAETFYDGKWHYLDLDVRAAFRRPNGTLASMEDARQDAALWTGRGPLFFPNDTLDSARAVYQKTDIDYYHNFWMSGHTMDYVLRQGETFTRWWTPQGGRWHHADSYDRQEWLRNLMAQPPRGPKPNHRDFTVWNYGNGRSVYQPNLTDRSDQSDRSDDFTDGAYDAKNVQPAADGLTLALPGEGYAVFEVRSPYIIVPKVGNTTSTDDDTEASVVLLDATGVALSVSADNGLTWRDVELAPGPQEVDLTRHVAGTYGYLLKLRLNGEPGKAVVRFLRITTWVQVAPAALPSLRQGSNRMELWTGDHYGLPTRVVEIRSEAGKPEGLLKYLAEPPKDYDPARKTSRVHGPMVAKIEAPPGAKIAWLSIGGSFETHQGEAASRTRNAMAYAVGEPKEFREIYRGDVPTYCNHWHCNMEKEVKLDPPARAVFVRYEGDPGVNNIRLYAHCLDDQPRGPSKTVITHTWLEGGARKTKRVELDRPGAYEIVCEADPTDETVEISVPSDSPPRPAPVIKVAEAQRKVRAPDPTAEPWVNAMRQVHARFTGEKGAFAHFGDSITDSRAFWTSLKWRRDAMPPDMEQAYNLVKGHMQDGCWDQKGAQFGNEGGQTAQWALQRVDAWLRDLNPETALIMFGTNDLNNIGVEKYEAQARELVRKCLANGTVVILSTIPPRDRFEAKSSQFADAIRKLARELKVPLTDFHADILKRRPADWDGALDKFAEYEGYDVPTLIARDGVHPSNPKQYSAAYSPEALNSSGFSLRNYLALVKYAEVVREVLRR